MNKGNDYTKTSVKVSSESGMSFIRMANEHPDLFVNAVFVDPEGENSFNEERGNFGDGENQLKMENKKKQNTESFLRGFYIGGMIMSIITLIICLLAFNLLL